MLALFAALMAPNPGMAGRTRLRVLRPCSTTVVDFIDHRSLALRTTLLFTVVLTAIMAALLVVLVRMHLPPLLAIEATAAIGMLTAHTTAKVTGGFVGKTVLAAR